MVNKIKQLQQSTIEQISKIIGDTNIGLTGSQIGQYLKEKNIKDIEPSATKWKRLYCALLNNHNITQCSNGTIHFIKHIMEPNKYLSDKEAFDSRREMLNEVLCFEGYQ